MTYEQYGMGRVLDPRTPRAVALHRVELDETTRTSRHYPAKTRLNQGNRPTCVSHAFGHRRANGPLQLDGIDEDWCLKFHLDATTKFYGAPDTDYSDGTSALSACEVLMDRGAIDWFKWMATPEEMRYTMLERGSICVGMSWYASMYETRRDENGHAYVKYNPATTRVGGHEMEFVGIDLNPADGSKPYYDGLQSWGPSYGDNGKVRFELDVLEDDLMAQPPKKQPANFPHSSPDALQNAAADSADPTTPDTKYGKAEVNYRPAGSSNTRCETCSSFSWSKGGARNTGTCRVVAGIIDPSAVCDKYSSGGRSLTDLVTGQPTPSRSPVTGGSTKDG
jgi:hypothetical protein